MNVLAKTKKYFPQLVEGANGGYYRNPDFRAFLQAWNTLLLCGDQASYDAQLYEFCQKYPKAAVRYCKSTGLIWKEKIVRFWVDQYLHFGYLVTSPVEGCHAGIKVNIKKSNTDLSLVFSKLLPYWELQHTKILNSIAKEFDKTLKELNVTLFYLVRKQIHGNALRKVLIKQGKLPAR
jgi:hypothetical protein